jgi:hypothetical protein
MAYKLTDQDRRDLNEALATIKRIIRQQWPEPEGPSPADGGHYTWGTGDGFYMALTGVISEALPDW